MQVEVVRTADLTKRTQDSLPPGGPFGIAASPPQTVLVDVDSMM